MPDTLPIRYAQSLLRLSSAPEDELRAELQSMRLPLVLLEPSAHPDATISADDYGRLFIHLVRKLQPELLGGEEDLEGVLEFSAYRMLFLAMVHSATLGQAMQRAAVYFRRFGAQGDSFVLETDAETARCRFVFSERSVQRDLLSAENFDMGQLHWFSGVTGRVLSIALWYRLCGWLVGTPIALERFELAQPRVDDNPAYAGMFGAPLAFDQPDYALVFPASFLDYPIVQGEAAVERLLETFPAELLKFDPSSNRLSERVLALIGTDFTRPLPGLQDVAERLFMTTPTLHRRLREEGTSFQQLKDEARRDAALALLQQGGHSNAQLAEMLGFSDSSTFQRAFKKWTGSTPQAYREQQA